MKTIRTEALVIGSGFGAAAPALRMAESGIEVLMIEKGPDIKPDRDFKQTSDPKYLLKYLKSTSTDSIGFTYAEGLGGGSGFYEMVSLRAPSNVFDLTDETGRKYWPSSLTRSVFDPFYDRAEQMVNVEQIGDDEIPKTGVVFSLMMKNLGYSCDRARYAVKGCVGSGFCVSGCVFGAKQSLHMNYLPQATAAGMKVLTDLEAIRIEPTRYEEEYLGSSRENEHYRYAVICKNTVSGEELRIVAHIVILGGGTVGTAKTLLRSREQMPYLSKHVGKNIAFNGSIKAAAILPDSFIDGDMLSGRSHPGMISYEFFDSHGMTVFAVKPLPLDVASTAHLYYEDENRDPKTWGAASVEVMKLYRRRMIILCALGLTRPSASFVQTGEDTFEPRLELSDEIRSYYKHGKELLHSIFTRNGCRVLVPQFVNGEGTEFADIHITTTHMIGSCRMSDSKKHGVCDYNGEVFDYPGLYISDGAAIPTSLAVNSSLTILANAERIGSHLAVKYGRRKITYNSNLYQIDMAK
ncbi:MAG TPA: GMC family oxidoreductase [Candidatus Kapabacteria bacterium]|nr:GMC family oxidoreductase [Candidatus Kapabacteria bacterium]